LKATEHVVQETTTTTLLAHVPTARSPSEEKQHLSVHHLFDGMSVRQDVTSSHVLHVTVTCVLYPVTEKVLHEVFDPYGVNEVSVLQEGTHVMAFVEFKSWREATIARDGLHGRCIYDNCCSLNIQYSSPSVIVSAPTPPIVVPAAATMTDQGLLLMATTPTAVRWRNQVVAASEVQVDDNLVAVTPTDCSVVGMCIDAGVQLSVFNREETMCAPVVTAELNGELKHDVELFSKEDYENVSYWWNLTFSGSWFEICNKDVC
jgi:hypothetical protein